MSQIAILLTPDASVMSVNHYASFPSHTKPHKTVSYIYMFNVAKYNYEFTTPNYTGDRSVTDLKL